MNAEKRRLFESREQSIPWKRWGPYLSERQWGTVREDYSPDGNAWDYISHDAARSRAYRWGEDGIAGFSDDSQLLCFGLALWNGRDPILKERLFGLTGHEGNHGEDVKELYYFLDSTPTHSFMKMLYKYPQAEYPYAELVAENDRRNKSEGEFELFDTGIFDDDRYFDVFAEYAKVESQDVLIRLTAHNRGPDAAEIHLLPQIWFRNTWAWGRDDRRPLLRATRGDAIVATHHELGTFRLYSDGSPQYLFCNNETNERRIHRRETPGFFKDGINDHVVSGDAKAVDPGQEGTKAAAWHRFELAPGESVGVRLRLTPKELTRPFESFDRVFSARQQEADEFYAELQIPVESEDARLVQRQALAGMLWSKQFYHFDVDQWLEGDPTQLPPPRERLRGRNSEWQHLRNADIISMPDTWEYPWYAAWDSAFHCVPLAMVDSDYAKQQLTLLTRACYMHPNGQLPAYEWAFGDVNPPVHAWAAWRVYQIDRRQHGEGDRVFLERVFQKLLLNFTWWVNRKDPHGDNLFQGGFLGLDNIGVFDRSKPLPTGGHVEQADGTAWMAMYSLNMLRIALELAKVNAVYQDLATKFFEHFLFIASAMTHIGQAEFDLWDDHDKFFYDVLHVGDNCPEDCQVTPLRVRSMVGLIPLFAVETLEPDLLEQTPEFARRMAAFLESRPDLASHVSSVQRPGLGKRRLLSLLSDGRLESILRRLLDPAEFLSDYGVRALSRHHADHPYIFRANGQAHTVTYQPAESDSGLFGGNSNWRGPVWFPVNFLLIESLQKLHHYYGDAFTVECPTGSGVDMTLEQVADELARRLCGIFLRDDTGRRPVFSLHRKLQDDPHFRDYVLYYEYFHGDNGRGVGASHQTGWTATVAKLLQPRRKERTKA